MGNILKANRYRLVDNSAFEMPLPLSFSVMNKESVIADYTISEDENITVNIVTKFKEEMLTSVRRALSMSDIYYLFSCRSFQDKTPFTLFELSLLGLKKYNVYDIIRKTHGITPFDEYWIRFDGESCSYDEALSDFNAITEAVLPPPAPQMRAAAEAPAGSFADIGEILNQHKIDVSEIQRTDGASPVTAASGAGLTKEEPPFDDNKMSQDEIEALLMKSGLSEPEPAPSTSGGMMSQEDIEKLLAANAAQPEPEPAPSSSGGMMSQEDIEKLLAANAAKPEPQPEPEPAPSTSGGMMSQEDIEKLLATNAAQPEPEPAPPTSGGMMSQEDIEKLLAANAQPEPEPAPPSSGGMMSQEDIEKLLAANAAQPEPEPAPSSSGGMMSQEDIEKLLAANAAQPEPEPAPSSSGGMMSQEDIEKLLNSMSEEAAK